MCLPFDTILPLPQSYYHQGIMNVFSLPASHSACECVYFSPFASNVLSLSLFHNFCINIYKVVTLFGCERNIREKENCNRLSHFRHGKLNLVVKRMPSVDFIECKVNNSRFTYENVHESGIDTHIWAW